MDVAGIGLDWSFQRQNKAASEEAPFIRQCLGRIHPRKNTAAAGLGGDRFSLAPGICLGCMLMPFIGTHLGPRRQHHARPTLFFRVNVVASSEKIELVSWDQDGWDEEDAWGKTGGEALANSKPRKATP